jgi:hypothetical protein
MDERFWEALCEVLDYALEEEEEHWEMTYGDSGEEGDNHIVHAYRVLQAAAEDHYKQCQSAEPRS